MKKQSRDFWLFYLFIMFALSQTVLDMTNTLRHILPESRELDTTMTIFFTVISLFCAIAFAVVLVQDEEVEE